MARNDHRWRLPLGVQARFLLMLALFVIASMTLLGSAMYLNQRQLMQDRLARDTRELTQALADKGAASSTFLARIAPRGILAYDFLLLEAYVEELSADPDIVYAVILNPAGEPITHFLHPDNPFFRRLNVDLGPETYPWVLQKIRTDPSLLTVKRDIDYEGMGLGAVEVGLSQEKILRRAGEIEADLQYELRRITLFTSILIIVSLGVLIALIEGAFRRLVVKPIRSLTQHMAQFQIGDLDTRVAIVREDEIGRLARQFNVMADDLAARMRDLEVQRRTYKETRDYLASILDNSADMIATTALDGTVVEFNTAAQRTLGYTREEAVGQGTERLYCDPEQRQNLYRQVRSGVPVQNIETHLRHKDDRMIDVELTLSPLRNNAGEVIGMVCIGRDITHAKTLRRELIQAEKLASVGQVAGWIAHQVRNSLGRILMNVAALAPARETSPAARAHADLSAAIVDMDRMVSDLLDYSKTLSLRPTHIDLNVALDDLLATLHADAGARRIRIEREYASDLPNVEVDVFLIEQAFGNVLRNAFQAMPGEGRLRVITRSGPREREVTVVIEDTGPGIPMDYLTEVFRPFFTTKPGGTGLGLAMTARIIETHGGHVNVTNIAGRGASFTFMLPQGNT